jgi:hypothetical protein
MFCGYIAIRIVHLFTRKPRETDYDICFEVVNGGHKKGCYLLGLTPSRLLEFSRKLEENTACIVSVEE